MKQVRGFGLIELLVVVSLVSMAVAAAVLLQGRATSGVDAGSAVSDVLAMASGMRQITSGRPSYEGLTHEHLIKAEKHPPHLRLRDALELTARWGSGITIGEVKIDGISHFGIRYGGMPASVCVSSVQALRDSFDMIRVRGDNVLGEPDFAIALAAACVARPLESSGPIIIDPTLPEPPGPGDSIDSDPGSPSGFGVMNMVDGLAAVEFIGR